MNDVTAVDAGHLLAPCAVAAETGPAAAADDPCPAGALSAVHELALADGAATATGNMDDSGWHLVSTGEGLVAWGRGLAVVDWLGRCHVHGWSVVVDRNMVSGGFVMNWDVVFSSVMCHLYYFIKLRFIYLLNR